MSDIFVPNTGPVLFSQIAAAFPLTEGGGGNNLGKLYAANSNIPVSGALTVGNFRGQTAPRPAFALTNTSGQT